MSPRTDKHTLLPSMDRLKPGNIPIPVRETCLVLKQAGYEAWIVGGGVRNTLLGLDKGFDWDIATNALPDTVQSIFPHTIPTGIAHGTITVMHKGIKLEVTTYRTDCEYIDGRHPSKVCFGVSLEEDLARRDFTVNALAYDPLSELLEDPFGGYDDLERGVIKCVGNPLERFREDGLRPMRACRFVAQLEFDLDEETQSAIPISITTFEKVAAERIGDEMDKMLSTRKPSLGLEALRLTGLMSKVLPELQACLGVMQNRFHAYDIYTHSIISADRAPQDKLEVRWAALLHDLGKLPTRRVQANGEATFYDHQMASASIARQVLHRLKRPGDRTRKIIHLIREHMFAYSNEWTDAAVRRFMRKTGMENMADLFDLRIADWFGNGTHRGLPRYLRILLSRIHTEEAKAAALKVTDLAVGGLDVMEVLNIPPSPPIGKCLNWLLEKVLDDPGLNTHEDLIKLIKEWDNSGRPEAPRDSIPEIEPESEA